MIPVDEEKGFQHLAKIWKSLEQRSDIPESVLERLHKFHSFSARKLKSVNEYLVQLLAKVNKAFPGSSALEIAKYTV